MIAVLVVRHGVLPAGALEATSEAKGNVLVVGSNCLAALPELLPYATHITTCEWGNFAPSAWAHALATHIGHEQRIVLPASPDGRDFAAHLAQNLQRPLYAGALRIGTITIELVRWSGQAVETLVADELGASVGATRVITDRSWVEHQRQIGTTGVVVNPQLYIALGVSGAVQHTSGLGQPEHIVSINTDPHCPMMQLADLGIVSDANEVLPALLAALQKRKSNV